MVFHIKLYNDLFFFTSKTVILIFYCKMTLNVITYIQRNVRYVVRKFTINR